MSVEQEFQDARGIVLSRVGEQPRHDVDPDAVAQLLKLAAAVGRAMISN
jgi:hypothetical protein